MKKYMKYHFRRLARELRPGDWIKVGGTLYEIQDVFWPTSTRKGIELRCIIRGIPRNSFVLSVPEDMRFTIYTPKFYLAH